MASLPAFKIDKEIPHDGRGSARENFFPFPDMKVGDSFLMPFGLKTPRGTPISASTLSSAAVSYGRKHGVKFSTRTVDGGIRCWRIA